MKCPHCKETKLVMTERKGIEIDYCPDCRGVWLDRGELDKLLEKAQAEQISSTPSTPQSQPQPNPPPTQGYYAPAPQPQSGHYHYKRKKSWLDDIFD